MTRSILSAILALTLASASVGAQVVPGGLELVLSEGTSRVLSPSDLAGLPAIEVTVIDGASASRYAGPAMRDLLTLAGAPAGRSLRGPSMSMVVLAEAADRYAVAFTVSELDPQFGNRTAILATSLNGGALGERDGPLQIVLPEDEFHARWVRQVVRLRVIQLPSGSEVAVHR